MSLTSLVATRDKLKKGIANENIPDKIKNDLKDALAKVEKEIEKEESTVKVKIKKVEKVIEKPAKKPVKKSSASSEKKATKSTAGKEKKVEQLTLKECKELLEKYRAQRRKRKAYAKSQQSKNTSTKLDERTVNFARSVSNIADAEDLTDAEMEKIISAIEEMLRKIKKIITDNPKISKRVEKMLEDILKK